MVVGVIVESRIAEGSLQTDGAVEFVSEDVLILAIPATELLR